MAQLINAVTGDQDRWVLQNLLAGGKLTAKGASDDYGIQRLAARINGLKNKGFQIESHRIKVPNRRGKLVPVAEYWIDKQNRLAATASQ